MKHIVLCIIAISLAASLSAKEAKTLPRDPAVTTGSLPNGMRYYVVSDPSMKGMADFALVQRTGTSNIENVSKDSLISRSREALTSIYRLKSRSVQDYFISLGAMPSANGFVEVKDDATIFRFENILLNSSPSAIDSSLLVLTGMVEKAAAVDRYVDRKFYSPSDQALIVAGDVDAKGVVEKIRMLSLMVPSSEALPRIGYEWKQRDDIEVTLNESRSDNLFEISALWHIQRTPVELMNSIQPMVYERYMTISGIVAEQRIRESLKMQGIPSGDVSFSYVSGIDTSGDEKFSVKVVVGKEHAAEAVSTLASVMSALDSSDAGAAEVARAERIYLENLAERPERMTSHLDRCISAFLYNSPLVTEKALVDFHFSRNLEDSVRVNIFNSLISASIDGAENLTLSCGSGALTESQIKEIFESAWKKPEVVVNHEHKVPAFHGYGEPVKIKSSKREPMSDGKIWTMSNGFKVMFKSMASVEGIYYSLSMNGGCTVVDDLVAGEGAYMSDILSFSNIGGVDSDRFLDVLRQNGLTMNFSSSLSTLRVGGHVKKGEMDLLVYSLLTLMNDRETDVEEFEYFMKSEQLRLEYLKGGRKDREREISNIMYPDYRYSLHKSPGRLTEGFAAKADAFMDAHSSKMNDGMLILVGDIDEKELKTVLQTYVGEFKTKGRSLARPVVNYQPISGTVYQTSEGDRNGMDIAVSVPMALTSDNYYTASIAVMALRRELAGAVMGKGMRMSLDYNCSRYPQERFNIMISLSETPEEGFAPGTVSKDHMAALNAVRRVLEGPVSVSASELSSYKSILKNHMAEQKKNPEYWVRAISLRYLDGKDFTTGCDARIDAVTADKVKNMLASLNDGARVEYIINGR